MRQNRAFPTVNALIYMALLVKYRKWEFQQIFIMTIHHQMFAISTEWGQDFPQFLSEKFYPGGSIPINKDFDPPKNFRFSVEEN